MKQTRVMTFFGPRVCPGRAIPDTIASRMGVRSLEALRPGSGLEMRIPS